MGQQYDAHQKTGSEYGGVEETSATIQPKGPEALSAGEQLRLFYLTGQTTDTEAIEDHRQMLGLLPANGERPKWLKNANRVQLSQAEIEYPELYE
jgi:hypothetical protein